MHEGFLARCAPGLVLLFVLVSSAHAAGLSASGNGEELEVLHYSLELAFDTSTETVRGTVGIALRGLTVAQRQLTIDMAPNLTAHTVSVDGAASRFMHSGSKLRLTLPAEFTAAGMHTIRIVYSGTPSHHLRFDTIGGKPAIASYGMPYSAMTWWPTLDEPSFKATGGADITISAAKGDVAVSNGVLVATQRLQDGAIRYHWHESYPIYPDVVSVAVGPYREIRGTFRSITGRTIPLTFYVFPTDLIRAASEFRVVPRILHRYEALFGPYPFQRDKYGLAEITIPSFREHQTIPSIGRGLLLGATPVWDLQNVQNVIAHDMAHQWFGNSVTPRHWSDVWLNEGFANYAVALWHEKEGKAPALRHFMRSLDTGPFKGSVRLAASNPAEDLLTYTTFNKGAWVLHMLRHVMGDRAFFAALRNYAQENRGGLVDTRTWMAISERQYGKPLGWFFHEWLYGQGRPALRVSWRDPPGRAALDVTLRQTQAGQVFEMPVDLELVTSDGSEVRTVWMRRRTQRFLLPTPGRVSKIVLDPDDWLLLTR